MNKAVEKAIEYLDKTEPKVFAVGNAPEGWTLIHEQLVKALDICAKEAEKQGKLNALGELSNGAEVIIIRSKQELEDIKNKAKQEGAEQIIEEFEKDFKGSLSDGIVAIESENWKEWKQKHLKKKGDEKIWKN